jgi:hypothetical protein
MSDKGHINLIRDLELVLEKAKKHEFHDKKSSEDNPKLRLFKVLEVLQDRVKIGLYDNQ